MLLLAWWVAGGSFFFDVMPRQVQAKAEKKRAAKVAPEDPNYPLPDGPKAADMVARSPRAGAPESTKSPRAVTSTSGSLSELGDASGEGVSSGVRGAKSQELRDLTKRGEREGESGREREKEKGEGERETLEAPRANSSDESDEEDVWEEVWEEVETES